MHGNSDKRSDLAAIVVTLACGATVFVPFAIHLVRQAAELKPSDWANWVQAIGSILGISVAIAVPWHQRWSEVNEVREKVRRDQIQSLEDFLAVLKTAGDSCVKLMSNLDKTGNTADLEGLRIEVASDITLLLAEYGRIDVRAMQNLALARFHTACQQKLIKVVALLELAKGHMEKDAAMERMRTHLATEAAEAEHCRAYFAVESALLALGRPQEKTKGWPHWAAGVPDCR